MQSPSPEENLSIPIGFIRELSETTSQHEVLQIYARWAGRLLDAARSTVGLSQNDDTLELVAIDGNQIIETGTHVPLKGTMIGRVFESHCAEFCRDLNESRDLADCAKLAEGGLTSCIDAPLISGVRCFGVLAVGFTKEQKPDACDLIFLEALARCLASYLQLHEQLEKMREHALVDPLTKAFNRRFFKEKIIELWDDWQHNATPVSLAMVDLDYFKQVNDTFGHAFGDRVLRTVADTLKQVARDEDYVVRMGGEEFCVILKNADQSKAEEIAEQLRQAIERLDIQHHNQPVPLTVSIGVSTSESIQGGYFALGHTADQALYRAKHAGRNQVVLAA